MENLFFRFLARLGRMMGRKGIDMEQVIIIVRTKLTMDRRRIHMSWRHKQQKKENANHLRAVLLSYLLFGLLSGLLVLAIPSFLIGMIFVHAYLMFMMAMTLITDFSTVLLDTADNQIILSKPVEGRTLFLARTLHILLYIFQFAAAMAAFPLAVVCVKFGMLTGLASLFTITLTVLVTVFITYILYMMVMRFANEQKLKEIIMYFQIFMGIFFMIGYQVVPRMMQFSTFFSSFTFHRYAYFLPPVWMAYLLDAIHEKNLDPVHLRMIGFAVLVPVGSFWLLIKWLAPVFGRKIAALGNLGDSRPVKDNRQKNKRSLSSIISRLACRSPLERAEFELVWKITSRDRGFRLQYYPSMGYVVVFMLIFIFRSTGTISGNMGGLSHSNSWLWFIYLPVFTVSTGNSLMAFNENYQASWVYHGLPVSRPGDLIVGSLKSLFIKYFLTVYLFLFAVALWVWGDMVIIQFAFGLLNNFFCVLLLMTFADRYLPFSRQPQTQAQTGRFLRVVLQLIIVSLLVGLHYLIIQIPILIYLLSPLVLAAIWLLNHGLRNTSWEKIMI
jgi:ABC-2 type transport system permease protein